MSLKQIHPNAVDYLHDLDLSYIIEFMCSKRYPLPRWTEKDARHCEKLYKNFLLLQKKNPHISLVPTREIDEFWHNHILYTQKYMDDCQQIFGFYFHHIPTSPTENPQKLIDHFTQTKQLYFAEFQENLVTFR